MPDLISRLSATLDELERVARDGLKRTTTSRRMINHRMVDVKVEPPEWRRSALPPEAVLRLVAAHRAILKLHEANPWRDPDGLHTCRDCAETHPCPTVVALAAGWGLPESEEVQP